MLQGIKDEHATNRLTKTQIEQSYKDVTEILVCQCVVHLQTKPFARILTPKNQ